MKSVKENQTPIVEKNYYTGEKSKTLFVHVMQDGVEVDKPVKAKIYEQSVTWNKRLYPIVPARFYFDHKGVAHQQVDANDVSVLTYHKDHTDRCKKCGGKMTVDARQARELGKRGVFHAIWGIDSTHMILLIIFALGMAGGIGGFFWAYNQDTLHSAQLAGARTEIARLNQIINPVPTNNTSSDGTVHRSLP